MKPHQIEPAKGRKLLPGERFVYLPPASFRNRLFRFTPYVRQSGDQIREPWCLKTRKLLDYLLVCVPKGQGIFTVDGNSFEVSDGSLIWIPPDTPHEMRGTSPEMHCVYFHFDLAYDPMRSHWDACIPSGIMDLSDFKELLHPPIDDPEISTWNGKLEVDNFATIMSMMQRICLEHRRSPDSMLALSGLVLRLLSEIIHGMAGKSERKPYWNEMNEAVSLINERLDGDLDVSSLAGEFNLSPSHFRKLFRQTHAQSPRSMHRRARIDRACELLVYTDMTVSEIAEKLGFSNIQSFSRAFRELVGLSPRNYNSHL